MAPQVTSVVYENKSQSLVRSSGDTVNGRTALAAGQSLGVVPLVVPDEAALAAP
jgi:hypothetical protein